MLGCIDIDIEILLRIDDKDLPTILPLLGITNKYLNNLCNSDKFWYRKLIDRITRIKNDNIFRWKDCKIDEINGENLKLLKEFFGFKTLKGLYIFLTKLSDKAWYFIYHDYETFFLRTMNELIDIDKDLLPKYINYNELVYYVRKHLAIEVYRQRIGLLDLHYPNIVIDDGYIKKMPLAFLSPYTVNIYKIVGIITD